MSDPSGRELPSASFRESLGFTLRVMLPNLLQGLFRRRPRAVAGATRLGVDRRARRMIEALRRRHGPGPVWVRAGGERMLLVLSTDDVRRVLEGSPHPFAPDPDAKRRGMAHFQPDALTISRGDLWANRRRFAEAVLDTDRAVHRHAGRFAEVAEAEVDEMVRGLDGESPALDWETFNRTGWRITRRIVLGDAARDDQQLTDLLWSMMDDANKLPKEPSLRLPEFLAKLRDYIEAAEEGSLVSLTGEAPFDQATRTERQITHWLFAMGDTLFANAFRAMAVIATHPAQREKVEAELTSSERPGERAERVASLPYLEACLQEAMRLWPTTPTLSRETLEETEWGGGSVPAGTQVLISNTFNHRDAERHRAGDRFEPEAWTEGDRSEDWSLNHFSHGPQGCPGTGIALFVGKAAVARLLESRSLALIEPRLDPGRPPEMLDYFRLRFAVEPAPRP